MSAVTEELDSLELSIRDAFEYVRLLEEKVTNALGIPVDPVAERIKGLRWDLAGLLDAMYTLAKRVAP